MSQTLAKFELRVTRTRTRIPDEVGGVLSNPAEVAKLARRLIGGRAQECVIALGLDVKNSAVGYWEIGIGGQSRCNVDVRILFRTALAAGVEALVLAHNHPTGNLTPSREDERLTEAIIGAGDLLGIAILDHVIVGPTQNYYSFASTRTAGF